MEFGFYSLKKFATRISLSDAAGLSTWHECGPVGIFRSDHVVDRERESEAWRNMDGCIHDYHLEDSRDISEHGVPAIRDPVEHVQEL